MEPGHEDVIPEMTAAIRARLVTQWEAGRNQDTASNDAVIAEEFDSFCPDGSRRVGKPTAEQMAREPIAGYKLAELRAVPLGADAALVTYFAHVSLPNDDTEYPMAVGEFWVKCSGEWFIRGFSGTLIK
jgi:hypothetical protein